MRNHNFQFLIFNFQLVVLALLLTSCTTTGGGAMTGAMFGSIIGSSIGGISGGPRGSDIGTLVGMAVGAGTGAAVGAANEAKEREQVREHYRNLHIDRKGAPGKQEAGDDMYGDSGYSADPVYDDRIDFDAPQPAGVRSATVTPLPAEETATPILIENARFINNDNTTHIAKGELVKISFEVRNVSGKSLYGIVPTVKETTGNKHLIISPATMIESIGSHRAIRYTAYISAEQSLKKGSAHFQITVVSAGEQLSNVIDFDVPLN